MRDQRKTRAAFVLLLEEGGGREEHDDDGGGDDPDTGLFFGNLINWDVLYL